jgi:hypothetical protein
MKLKNGIFTLFVLFILFLIGDNINAQTGRTVGPLLQTTWGLGSPYNNMVPMDGNSRSSAGCIAIAMAQIMNFHRHPVRGTAQSEPYTTTRRRFQIPSVNFNIIYDWNNMLNCYRGGSNEQQQNAVATLVYHAGVSVQMCYASSGGSSSGSARIPRALVNHFGYDRSILWRHRSYYDSNGWEQLLREQLDAGMPIIYAGAGHVFIVDGYDNEGRFHFNWGERGNHDGWYFINSLSTPVRTVGDDMHIFINIKPDQGGVSTGYEMVLRGVFTASKTTVPQNETFTVNANMRNISAFEGFTGGHLGVVLIDNNDNIVEFLGTRQAPGLGIGNTWPSVPEINCYVPETVRPGQYRLRIATRTNDGDWRIIALSEIENGIPNGINFTVTPAGTGALGGGYWLSLEVFSADKVSVSHNETFSVDVRTRAVGTDRFPGGQLGVALVDNNGSIVEVIRSINWGALNPGAAFRGQTINNCRVPNTVSPGRYQLMIVTRPTGGEWRIASISRDNTPNSIDFEVR